jgi:hypothetical protein
MSLSSHSCLKRIRSYVENSGYKNVSDERVREACLSNNFDPRDAADQLIKEEQLKINLEGLCVDLGYEPIKAFISTSCIKYKFAQEPVKKYIMKLLEAKHKVIIQCEKENITTPKETVLDELILFYFGNWKTVLHNIRQDL